MKWGLLFGPAAVSLLLAAGSADAAPGVLDPSFGAGTGEVTTPMGTSASADAVALQPDGKIVAAGAVVQSNHAQDFALVRYAPDGSLDPTFGIGGLVQGPSGTVAAVAVQPDGKVVAAGTVSNEIRVARYDADGSLDQSFGSAGVVTTAATGFGSDAKALLLQPDGKIVVGGESSDGSETLFTLVRYDANGSLDPTFGSGGIVTTQVGAGNSSVEALALQPDGRIVADGDAVNASSLAVPGLVRYTGDGSLDTTFGSGGIVTTPVYGAQGVTGGPLSLQPDGKIVTAGTSQASWVVARYESDGSLDTSFGSGGSAVLTLDPDARASSLVLQPDGKILVAGSSSELLFDSDTPSEFLELARFDPDGTADETFSSFGLAFMPVWSTDGPAPPSPPPSSPAIALQPDGRIVAAGSASDDGGTTQQFLLARFGASTLTVNLGDSSLGTGGEISSSPAGIDCSVDSSCFFPGFFTWDHAFAAGPVTLTATPWSGWHFAGWSGDGCSGTGTCRVRMSGDPADDQQVTANFVPLPATLTVLRVGSGTGTVTSSPAGIDCGHTCSHVFLDAPMVTLTAHPARGSRFSGWSGTVCSGRGTCTVTMDASRAVAAGFQGFCIVPRVKGQTLRTARNRLLKAHCRAGRIRRRYSSLHKGRVLSQKPAAKRRLRSMAKVALVVSKGRRP